MRSSESGVNSSEVGVKSSEYQEAGMKGPPEDRFDFEELLVYQKALEYIGFVYEITEKFPESEKYGLSSNFQRAAQSIALNIGEGSGGTKTEFARFLRIARRSVRECLVSTTIAKRRDYVRSSDERASRDFCCELSKMLSGLIKSLRNK